MKSYVATLNTMVAGVSAFQINPKMVSQLLVEVEQGWVLIHLDIIFATCTFSIVLLRHSLELLMQIRRLKCYMSRAPPRVSFQLQT